MHIARWHRICTDGLTLHALFARFILTLIPPVLLENFVPGASLKTTTTKDIKSGNAIINVVAAAFQEKLINKIPKIEPARWSDD